MLSELCSELNNYFDKSQPKKSGEFHISSGHLSEDVGLQVGQYYRIIGSVFNDGVHQYKTEADADLKDETFSGSVWLMAVPKEFVDLAKEIADWQKKYGEASMNPLSSESLTATSYSYSLNAGSGASGSGSSWEAVFASRLTKWRRIRGI